MRNPIASIAISFFVLNVINFAYGVEALQTPAPKDGDRWEFKAETKSSSSSTTDRLNGNYEMTSMKGQLEVFQIVDGQKSAVGPNSTEFLKRMLGFAQDDQQYLKFPLAAGNKWRAEYSVQSPGTRRAQRRSAEFRAEDKSQIKTLAGNFEALKIKGTNAAGPVPQEWEYFYNADCKCIVKFFYDSAVGGVGSKVEIELVKFSPSGS